MLHKAQLIIVGVVCILISSCSPNKAISPSHLLVFNQRTENYSKIYTMHPDGSDITLLATLPSFSAHWLSPDGTKLASLIGNKVVLMNNLTTEVIAEINEVGTTVSEHFIDIVVWSPDGNKLVFMRDSAGKRGINLWLYDLEARTEIPLTNDESVDLYPAWSVDGKKIAFVSHQACHKTIWDCPAEQEYWDISIINLQSFERKTVTDFKRSGILPTGNREYALLCNLSWSPDSSYITFENACSRPGLQWWKQLFVVSTDGSQLFQLTHYSEYSPTATEFPISLFRYSTQWLQSANTLLIAYTEAELIENGILKNGFFIVTADEFSIPLGESKSNLLGSNGYWSPNGKYVIGNATAVVGFPRERPFIAQLENEAITRLTSSETFPYGSCQNDLVYWSSDSKYVAYAATENGPVCSYGLWEQDIAIISITDTTINYNTVALEGYNVPIGWLTLP